MEKTKIIISYAHPEKQVPDLMINKLWYDSETKEVTFGVNLYTEDIQKSDIYHDCVLLKESEVNMINTCKDFIKNKKKISAIKYYKNYTNVDLQTAHKFILELERNNGSN